MFSDVLLRMKTSLPLKNEKIEKKCKKESAHFWKDSSKDVLLFYAHQACFRKQAEGRKIIFLSKEHFFRVWFVVLRLNMDRGNSLARLAKKSFFVCRKFFFLKDHANTRKLRRALKVWLDFSCSISRFVCAGVLLSVWKTFLHRPRFRQAISLGKNCFGIPCVFRKYVTPSLPFRKVEVKIARTEW